MYTMCYDLASGRVLLLSRGPQKPYGESNETILRIFSIDDLSKCLLETTLPGHYYFLCSHAVSGAFLVSGYEKNAARVGAQHTRYMATIGPDLKLLSKRAVESELSPAAVLDDLKEFNFFHMGSFDKYLWFTFYAAHPFERIADNKFADLELPDNVAAQKIISLGHNKYCVSLKNSDDTYFSVLIFEMDFKQYAAKQLELIVPDRPATSMEVLSDGNLITYHHALGNLQLWDSRNFDCLKTWSWDDIKKPQDFCLSDLRLQACPESSQLFARQRNEVFLLDLETSSLEPLNLHKKYEAEEKSQLSYSDEHHVLKNNKVITFYRYPDLFETDYTEHCYGKSPNLTRFTRLVDLAKGATMEAALRDAPTRSSGRTVTNIRLP